MSEFEQAILDQLKILGSVLAVILGVLIGGLLVATGAFGSPASPDIVALTIAYESSGECLIAWPR